MLPKAINQRFHAINLLFAPPNSMSPYDTPALFNLLQYTEIAEGVWYPRGGFHQVIESLERIASKKFGAKFLYNKNIDRIIVDSENVARGIRLDDGSEEYADIVVCNADLVYAYNHLLPKTKYGTNLGDNAALTSSSISFYWGLSRKLPELDVHNVFLAKDYKTSFDTVFQQQILSDDPFFYVNVPSRIDESAAPADKETVVLLLPIAHITENNKDCLDEWVERARFRVIQILEERLGLDNFESLIETEVINDPRNWQSKFNLWKGAILGMSHSIPQVLHYRPSIRCNIFKNLYFVGASVHPGSYANSIYKYVLIHDSKETKIVFSSKGTGVPIVLCGAKLAEQQILKDYGLIERNYEDFIIISQFVLLGFMLIAAFLWVFYNLF